MKNNVAKILKTLLSVALAAVLLWFSFRGVDWKEFASQMQHCRWIYVILSMIAGALAFAFRGLRWKKILEPLDPSIKAIPSINGINVSNVANMVIPYSGELVRCGIITRHSRRDVETGKPMASFDKVLGTAILERGWDILSVLLILVFLLVFMWDEFGQFITDRIINPIVGEFNLVSWLVISLVLIVAALSFRLIYVNRDKGRLWRKAFDVCKRLWQGFVSCFKMKSKLLFFLYTALIWGMYWLQMIFIKEAMPVMSDLGLVDTLFLMLVGSFASCMPVPGGFGAYHYIISTALFAIYGFPKAGVGIVFATLSHESQALTMIITGLGSYVIESVSKGNRNSAVSE